VESSTTHPDTPREVLIARIDTLEQEVEKLQLLLIQANKRQFGKKSEKLSSSEQGALFTFEAPAAPITDSVEVDAHTRVVTRGRKPLPDNLPRNRIEYKPEETQCPCCKKELTYFDGEVTEELEFVPEQLVVNEHVRLKGVCPDGCRFGVETGEIPDTVQPLSRRRPGAGLLAHICVSKFVDHLPLYRQEEAFRRRHVEIRRQRLSDWVAATSDEIFFPLWKVLKQETLQSSYVQGDETEIKVQESETEGTCHKGYFWAAHAVREKLAFFEYHESRAGNSAKEVFEGFSGTLQTDLYAGYNTVILPDKVERIACLAHVRRKFIEAQPVAKTECGAVLNIIGKLYGFEKKWSNAPPDTLRELRARFSKPELETLHRYLVELREKTLPQAPLQKAITYTLSQWTEIERIFESGIFELDNNGVERQIRPIAIGRKNYLFAGSHDGARNAAVIYSLIATCKLNKINVFDWMKDVIARVPSYPISKIGDLLPQRWAALRKTEMELSTA
jgi:transposase